MHVHGQRPGVGACALRNMPLCYRVGMSTRTQTSVETDVNGVAIGRETLWFPDRIAFHVRETERTPIQGASLKSNSRTNA